MHGYDFNVNSMHALFLAKGPLFPKGKQIEPFENVHLYGMFCAVLNITCHFNGATSDLLWRQIHQ